jgi:hypothetical protein
MLTMPSRSLCPIPGQKPLKYTNKDNTDIRKTFAKWQPVSQPERKCRQSVYSPMFAKS